MKVSYMQSRYGHIQKMDLLAHCEALLSFLYSFTSSFGKHTENYHLNLQLPSAHCLAVWPSCFMF